ncbi:hypothetical protein AERO8C_160096 [Aeromonas veronii]|uniref:Uncharacterized protein n=1 Tax=Aeromonas veronii TaxID=654 RepID=A0A653KWX4_AERVE|nr:hypothetical protein AERO8C_160096 [Aeromonas veronii]
MRSWRIHVSTLGQPRPAMWPEDKARGDTGVQGRLNSSDIAAEEVVTKEQIAARHYHNDNDIPADIISAPETDL